MNRRWLPPHVKLGNASKLKGHDMQKRVVTPDWLTFIVPSGTEQAW